MTLLHHHTQLFVSIHICGWGDRDITTTGSSLQSEGMWICCVPCMQVVG
jgi:hypothetical protein